MYKISSSILNTGKLVNSVFAKPITRQIHNLHKIGTREVVGYGRNGGYGYYDSPVYPMPGIRWKEETPRIAELRELEKGDWHKISISDKKELYRATFRQTYAEFSAPTGEWKLVIGMTLIICGVGLLASAFQWKYVCHDLPDTMLDPEKEKAQLKRMILLQVNPIHGISSKWDYENWKWK